MDSCNFADNTTMYVCGKYLYTIFNKLELKTNTGIQWLTMVAHPSKFQLMFFSKYKNIDKTCLVMWLFQKVIFHR